MRSDSQQRPYHNGNAAVIVAESDRHVSVAVCCLLKEMGMTAITVRSGSEALEWCRKAKPSIVLAAADLPDIDPVSFLKAACAEKNRPAILMVKSGDDGTQNAALIELGAFEVIEKPVNFQTFPLVMHRALATRSLRRKVSFLKKVAATLTALIPLVVTAGILMAVN
jgi:two-component system, NtrC family, phosphoglycerate transport system response regulator PgtA